MSDEEKSISKSVSLPGGLWEAVDRHADSDPQSGDRSTYIRRLVSADLEAAGKLPGSRTERALEKARTILRLDPEQAEAEFDNLLRRLAETAVPEGSGA